MDGPAGLREAMHLTGRLVEGVRPDQWTAPTPCAEWTVRDLVQHLVYGQVAFARLLGGEPLEAVAPAAREDHLGDDAAAAYRRSCDALLAAVAEPGVLERPVRVPVGTVPGAVAVHLRTVECLVHGWDLARATGQPFDVPGELAEAELAFSRDRLGSIPPDRTPFGAPRPVAVDAPPLDRLVALLGRDPGA
jgi:uncharacterized protein (TIGR03086 family)